MKLLLAIFFILLTPLTTNADDLTDEDFNQIIAYTATWEEDLHRMFIQKEIHDLTTEEKEKIKNFSIERKINPEYIKEYEKIYKTTYTPTKKLNPKLIMYYDPEYYLEYLEKIPAKTLYQKYQLLLLWQLYKQEKINTPEYSHIATLAHNKTTEYLSNETNWQSPWRKEEYEEIIKDDFLACYKDLKCLLTAIPYWMALRIPMNVVIPCEIAQKNNLIYYIDSAGGGAGAQTTLVSDCPYHKQYTIPDELHEYISNNIWEKTYFSTGSINNVFLASADMQYFDIIYNPNRQAKETIDWREFPYTEWSVNSYYNFKKFNSVLNYPIDHKKAINLLQNYYINSYNIPKDTALNMALYALLPPTFNDFSQIDKNNLNYLLLTGAPWEKILKQIPQNANPLDYLELSIDYPENLLKLIELGKQRNYTNVDKPNNFGKTALQTAAQYGLLDSVKILHKYGANINHQTNDTTCSFLNSRECIFNGKRTALMYATQEGHYDVIKYLTDNGADISLTDSQKNNAYTYLLGNAPHYSKKNSPTIYGGYSIHKENAEIPSFTKEQKDDLEKILFSPLHQEISAFTEGEWKLSAKADESEFFEGKIFIKKNKKENTLLTIHDLYGISFDCKPLEINPQSFNCLLKYTPEDDINHTEMKAFTIPFLLKIIISHSINEDLVTIKGISKKQPLNCNENKNCSLSEIAIITREREF